MRLGIRPEPAAAPGPERRAAHRAPALPCYSTHNEWHVGKNGEPTMHDSYTHITVILDRTGSMQSIRDDVIGGFNAFLQEQQALPGKATLTLVQFDSQDPYEVLCRFPAYRRGAAR